MILRRAGAAASAMARLPSSFMCRPSKKCRSEAVPPGRPPGSASGGDPAAGSQIPRTSGGSSPGNRSLLTDLLQIGQTVPLHPNGRAGQGRCSEHRNGAPSCRNMAHGPPRLLRAAASLPLSRISLNPPDQQYHSRFHPIHLVFQSGQHSASRIAADGTVHQLHPEHLSAQGRPPPGQRIPR